MITVVEPKEYITKLWGKQQIREEATYRLMRYVLRVNHDGKVLLHNVVTGHLVVLDQTEVEALEKLPMTYRPVMEALVAEHYLVPEDYEEDLMTVNLRRIIQNLVNVQKKSGITKYTILPTTCCNARCYYCYERGIVARTMTEEVADQVIRFITDQCKGQKVRIRWFGGEPTLVSDRISQISYGLRQNKVDFSSTMISNGYLFDKEMVYKAATDWNMSSIKISIDGVKNSYNRIKNYINVEDDPYERILRNIGFFLEKKIMVSVFMNFDKDNYCEFESVLNEFEDRFNHNPFLRIQSHQLVLNYSDSKTQQFLAGEAWYQNKINELNTMSRSRGFLSREIVLPSIEFRWCEASSGTAITILPRGTLVSCPEQLTDDQIIGDLSQGITNEQLAKSWRQVKYSERCRNCILFPSCMKIQNCGSSEKCFIKLERMDQYRYSIKQLAENGHIS